MSITVPPPMQSAQPGKSLLSPMVLSALVYTGAGQLMQRRWAAALFFLISSTVSVIWLVSSAFIILKAYYGMAFDSTPVATPRLASLIVPFVMWLVIYVAGIVDTAIASYRQRVKREA